MNDVCLRQMMTASPNDVRFANDVWLRHILWQTSHHCKTKWSNIIFAKQMHHVAIGDASLKCPEFYDIITFKGGDFVKENKLADMLSKFEIALKECSETEGWLKLLFNTNAINEDTYKNIEICVVVS